MEFVKIFSHSVLCHYFQMMVSLQKLFSCMRSHILITLISVCTNVVLSRNASPAPMSSRFFHIFSSVRLSVYGFRLSFLIHLELNFTQNGKYESIFIPLHAVLQFDQHNQVDF